jgi:3-oxoacyl-[acyl-carrier-protein] synthase-3
MGVRFKGWGIGLPDRIVTNDELSLTLDTSDEWISERTGIRQRYIGGTARSLGVIAGRNAMADAGVEPEDIDFCLLATTSPDRIAPATAVLIANELGLTCPAMDVNAACSGFMYAVRTAQGLLETGNKRILVIGAEHLSKWVDWTERNVAVLLADGGGATVLEYDPDINDILSFSLGADGSGADLLTCEHEGSSQQAIERAGITADDLALVIPHQANLRIIQAVVDRLGIGMDRAVIALDRYGNTSSASIPLAFDVARNEGRIKTGDYALLTGFGAGMTWASSVVKWS